MGFWITVSVLATAASYAAVGGMRYWARKQGIIDLPNERSSHTRPTPRGGGIAIVIGTLVGLVALSWDTASSWSHLIAYVAGAVLVAAVSWVDDVRSLPNRLRFLAHVAAALIAISASGYWPQLSIPALGPLTIGWLGLPLSIVWIVGLTNAYNFMDGIDGIAGGQALVAGLGWTAIGWLGNHPLLTFLGLLLAATSAGFLGHNWPPAKIFMGDVGSAFLGYSFAVLALIGGMADGRLVAAGPLLVWPFVFDSTFTLLRRWRNGENIFAAHRSHFYQRLVITGLSHQTVTLLYMWLACVGTVVATNWILQGPLAEQIIITVIPAHAAWLWWFAGQRERDRSRPHSRDHAGPGRE